MSVQVGMSVDPDFFRQGNAKDNSEENDEIKVDEESDDERTDEKEKK